MEKLDHHIAARKEDLKKIAETVTCGNAKELFLKTKLDLFTKSNKIHSVMFDEKLDKALKILSGKSVLSIPVYNKRTKTHEKFLDVLDVVTFISTKLKKKGINEEKASKMKTEELFDIETFKKSTVKDVASINKRSNYYSVSVKEPLFAVLDNVCKYNLHRVPIIEEDGSFVDIVSQSDLVNYVLLNKLFFKDLLVKKVGELFKKKKVFSVKKTDTLDSAFKMIHENNVSGVAVVDDQGKLIGGVSGSDVSVIDFEGMNFNILFSSVSDALGKNKYFGNPICVTQNDSFKDLLDKIGETHVHRVIYVDSQSKPVGMISLYDMLSKVKEFLAI